MYFICRECGFITVEATSCPWCDEGRMNRWKEDPFIVYHSEMAAQRGLLIGNDISEVQSATLAFNHARANLAKQADQDMEWEQQFVLHQPEAYRKWKEEENAKEIYNGEQVQFFTPESLEEAAAAIAVLDQLDKSFGPAEAIKVMNQATDLSGINLDLIKDEEE